MATTKSSSEIIKSTKVKSKKHISHCIKMEEQERNTRPVLRTQQKALVGYSQTLIWVMLLATWISFVASDTVSQQQIQPPRFTTQPSSSASIVSEGRTKILQCYALGKLNFINCRQSIQFRKVFF